MLIAGRYAVDPSRPIQGAGGGVPAYSATDRQTGDTRLIALAVGRHAGPRLSALQVLDRPVDNLMGPLGHGVGPRPDRGQGYYIICAAPPGPALAVGLEPWPEAAVLEQVLRPAAQVLAILHDAELTHRAIRPDNVFAAARGQQVTLGAAWAAPPAMHQPTVFEAPVSAMCHPAGRGDGTGADDIYALGVLLLVLTAGQIPMAGLDDATIISRKLDLGSFAALTAGIAVPAFLGDLLRGMLAEEPEHRTQPGLLTDLARARSRRITSRPPRRSQRPLMLNYIAVYDARILAYALSTDVKMASRSLRDAVVTQWLRRGLGDGALAATIEELIRVRLVGSKPGADPDALLVMQTIIAIDPHMPLCWQNVALWPAAIGSLLAEGIRGNASVLAVAQELLRDDILSSWSQPGARAASENVLLAAPEGRQLRMFLRQGGEGAMLRAFYFLNPLLPCGLPAMSDGWVIDLSDLMRFLEKAAGAGSKAGLVDLHLRAFIAARGDRQIDSAVNLVIKTTDPKSFRMRQLALLRDLQQRYHNLPMPALAAWMAEQLRPDLQEWRNQATRAALIERLNALAQAGFLGRLLAVVDDDQGRAADTAGAKQAAFQVAAIDAELSALARSGDRRRAVSERFGREIAAAIGLTALILMLLVAVFG
jgi:eukaryotic-like serine/threonine-protein kinase